MKRALFTTMMCTVLSGMIMTSCMDSTDVHNPNAATERYEKAWEKNIGKIDPNQDWNTATKAVVNANIPFISGESELRVYNKNILEKECTLLAVTTLKNGQGRIALDMPKNLDKVFVTIKSNEHYYIYESYNVKNGVVNVAFSEQGGTASTRAEGRSCATTKGTNTIISEKYNSLTQAGWNVNGYDGRTYEAWEQYYREMTNFYYNGGPYTLESVFDVKTDEWGNKSYSNPHFDNPVVRTDITVTQYHPERNIILTPLDKVERIAAEPWVLSWGWQMFGPGTFFEEQEKYYTEKKKRLYGGDTGIKKIEAGFAITTSGGEIRLPFIYGATQKSNKFGYVYYKDGQDPLTQPHYILIADGKPQSNIYWHSYQGTALNDGMALSNWTESDDQPIQGYDKDTQVYGTRYTLAFFGEDHAQAATYTFPAGYKIVFFIYQDNYVDSNQTLYTNNFNYSLPELNLRLGHQNENGTPSKGAVKAASWSFKGHIFFGFEDGGGDEDLNDIVFWAEGAYIPGEEPVEIPNPDPDPEPQGQSWILACEDLGGEDDFDFNDVVFSVTHVAGQTTATVTPLAAGGILDTRIMHNGQAICSDNEIHSMLGVSGQTIVNTNGDKGKPGKSVTINVSQDFSMADNMGDFSVLITDNRHSGNVKTQTTVNAPGKGLSPQMICIDGSADWAWPVERVNIATAYPDFGEWGANYNNTDWYKKPATDKVVK